MYVSRISVDLPVLPPSFDAPAQTAATVLLSLHDLVVIFPLLPQYRHDPNLAHERS